MRKLTPSPIISICADIIATRETHATLDKLFAYAGATGEAPTGNKVAKAIEWLRMVNKDESIQPLDVLGRLIENYMEMPLDLSDSLHANMLQDREKISNILGQYQLQYLKGGRVVGALGSPSRTLEEYIHEKDIASINDEFNRALTNVETNPREAVSAASNILESLCKIYIAEEGLDCPAKQDLKPIWTVVRKDLGFDPSAVEDQDLQTVLTGLISIVEGIGAFRTHASSAHGAGKKLYKLEPRHARLVIHAAHTVTLFVLESWGKKKRKE